MQKLPREIKVAIVIFMLGSIPITWGISQGCQQVFIVLLQIKNRQVSSAATFEILQGRFQNGPTGFRLSTMLARSVGETKRADEWWKGRP